MKCPHCQKVLSQAERNGAFCPLCQGPLRESSAASASSSNPSGSASSEFGGGATAERFGDAAAGQATGDPAKGSSSFSEVGSHSVHSKIHSGSQSRAQSRAQSPSWLQSLFFGILSSRLGSGLVLLAIIFGIALGVEYYRKNIQPNVWIYVDNGSGTRYQFVLDEGDSVDVEGNSSELVKCHYGEHQVRVDSNGTTIYEGTIRVGRPDFYSGPTRIVLNPDGRNRYWLKEIQYGSSFPDFRVGLGDDAHSRALDLSYQIDIVKQEERWFQVETYCDYMMDDEIPEKIKVRTVKGLPAGDKKTALRRLSKSDYDRILRARKGGEETTEADVSALQRIVRRLLKN